MKLRNVLLLFSMLIVGSAVANADPIGGLSCESCFGSMYTLTSDFVLIGDSTYQVQLAIDPTGYIGQGTSITAVAIKVSSSADSATLEDAPGGADAWNLSVNTGVNANGCSEAGGGFICAGSTDGGVSVPFEGTYTWTFNVTLPAGTDLLLDPFQASVKALYVDVAGAQAGITSEGITLQGGPGPGPAVPEPSTLLLFGTGLLGLAAVRYLRK